MRTTFGMLIAFMLVITISSFAFARGAPTKQKAFTSNTAVEMVSPVVATVPAQVGYDVIENISQESRDLAIAQNTFDVDTSAQMRLSTTGARRSNYAMSTNGTARSSPCIVMRA